MVKTILLDIEGTTTPIDFVHKTLFPFAKERMGRFVAEHFDGLRAEISQLAEEHARDAGYTVPLDPTEPGSVSVYLEYLIDQDRKSTPLKSIQGMIWQAGYEAGELQSIAFDDVPRAFERWKADGQTIAIYSSGSVLAQQLLFRYTDHGDLTQFIDAYFDTTSGPKREADSYRTISLELEVPAADVLFVSDIPAELDAASEAGMQTAVTVRPGNAEIAGTPAHKTIKSLDELP